MSLVQNRSVAHNLDYRSHAARWQVAREDAARKRRIQEIRPGVSMTRAPPPRLGSLPPAVYGARPEMESPMMRKPRSRSEPLDPLELEPELPGNPGNRRARPAALSDPATASRPPWMSDLAGPLADGNVDVTYLLSPKVLGRFQLGVKMLPPLAGGQSASLPNLHDPAAMLPPTDSRAITSSAQMQRTAEGFRSAAQILQFLGVPDGGAAREDTPKGSPDGQPETSPKGPSRKKEKEDPQREAWAGSPAQVRAEEAEKGKLRPWAVAGKGYPSALQSTPDYMKQAPSAQAGPPKVVEAKAPRPNPNVNWQRLEQLAVPRVVPIKDVEEVLGCAVTAWNCPRDVSPKPFHPRKGIVFGVSRAPKAQFQTGESNDIQAETQAESNDTKGTANNGSNLATALEDPEPNQDTDTKGGNGKLNLSRSPSGKLMLASHYSREPDCGRVAGSIASSIPSSVHGNSRPSSVHSVASEVDDVVLGAVVEPLGGSRPEPSQCVDTVPDSLPASACCSVLGDADNTLDFEAAPDADENYSSSSATDHSALQSAPASRGTDVRLATKDSIPASATGNVDNGTEATDAEQSAAATKLQSIARGNLGRQEAKKQQQKAEREEVARKAAAESEGKQLEIQCDCGNIFVGDALFCRKCGSRRESTEESVVEDEAIGSAAVPILALPVPQLSTAETLVQVPLGASTGRSSRRSGEDGEEFEMMVTLASSTLRDELAQGVVEASFRGEDFIVPSGEKRDDRQAPVSDEEDELKDLVGLGMRADSANAVQVLLADSWQGGAPTRSTTELFESYLAQESPDDELEKLRMEAKEGDADDLRRMAQKSLAKADDAGQLDVAMQGLGGEFHQGATGEEEEAVDDMDASLDIEALIAQLAGEVEEDRTNALVEVHGPKETEKLTTANVSTLPGTGGPPNAVSPSPLNVESSPLRQASSTGSVDNLQPLPAASVSYMSALSYGTDFEDFQPDEADDTHEVASSEGGSLSLP